jgi:serine/threonine protein phosphatase PrpC
MTQERLALQISAGTDVGKQRDHNEDSAYHSPRLLAVADGMGGHAHGEVASAAAVGALADLDASLAEHAAEHGGDLTSVDLAAALTGVVPEIRRRMDDLAAEDPTMIGMGTTLTALLFDGTRLAIGHVGDSRGYLLRGDEFRAITHDHTLVQSLLDEGKITEEEAEFHPRRSVLVRALQTGSTAEADVSVGAVRDGDRFLLCSDGLTDMVPVAEVRDVLATVADRDEAIARLIELANDYGGQDNITCVVADARPGEPEEAEGVVLGAAASRPTGRPAAIPGWLEELLQD